MQIEQTNTVEKNYNDLDNDELVILFRNGSERAFNILHSRFANIIKYKASKYYAPGVERDDLIQEGTIGFLNSLKDYNLEHPTPFKNFCELCVERQIITAVKTATRQKHMPLNQFTSFDKPIFEENKEKNLYDFFAYKKVPNPEDIFIWNENIYEILCKLKDRLSPLEMKVLEKQILKFSYLEISEDLKKPIKSIDNAMQRIRGKLEQIVAEKKQSEKELDKS